MNRRLSRLLAWLRRNRGRITAAATVVVLLIVGLALRELLSDLHRDDIAAALRAVTAQQILLALGLTVASYVTLTGYDALALHAIGKPQPYWRAALGSFSAYCFSHNFGFAPITGAAARWRAYRGTAVNAADIARIVVIAGVTFWLGIFVLLGIFLVLAPGALRYRDHILPYPLQAALGIAVLGAMTVYLIACARQTGPLNMFGWTLPVPTLRQALIQFALAATDIAIASAALLVLLPDAGWAAYPDFVIAYVVAMVVALLTHSPGGLGVFEAVILVTLPQVEKASLVGALLLYRVLYYWLPLVTAALALGIHELRLWWRERRQAGVHT
jgi:phosphatidylglycerol lysyltransferase